MKLLFTRLAVVVVVADLSVGRLHGCMGWKDRSAEK